jgi:hypothetical protein
MQKPHPPVIFPLHLQVSPDGLPSLAGLFLEPQLRALYLTPAHTPTDPVRAEPQSQTLTAHTGKRGVIGPTPKGSIPAVLLD